MSRPIPYILFFILLLSSLAFAQEDIFQVKTPNVMIIFDTSSSMDKTPNQADATSSNVCVDSFGRLQPNTPSPLDDGNPPCVPPYTQYNFEGGANHPSSKLYQAKLALKEVIESEAFRDRVNLGFATYAQFKMDKIRGYYKRDRRNYTAPVAEYWTWYKRYWRFNNYRHSNSRISYISDSFMDEWGTTHTGVSVGYWFERTHTFDNSPANNSATVPPLNPLGSAPGTYTGNLRYRVNNIVYNAEYNRYTYYYDSDFHDHYEETWRYINRPNNSPIHCNAQFSKIWGAYQTFDSTDPDQMANPGRWACSGPHHVPEVIGGFGPWFTEYDWLEFSDVSCPVESGSDHSPANANQWTKWTQVDPAKCYDWSTYYYPADGAPNKPHTWSYFKINDFNWHENLQLPNYYPSRDDLGHPNKNPGTFNNRRFFINFPDDKEAGFTPAIRTANREQMMSFLDLTPVQSPETLRYWTKLPIHTFGGRAGLTSNTTESFFTPLADSLKYAFKYFNDYIQTYHGGDPSSRQLAADPNHPNKYCRGNYIILLTDGLESARCLPPITPCPAGGTGNPDYGAAPSEAANLKGINVNTFVIGFGTDLKGNETLNRIALSGGTANAYFAGDLSSLMNSLETIFEAILDTAYGRSNPVITKSGDRIFKGFFEFTADQSWKGGLYAYEINKATGEIILPHLWDAGEKLTLDGRGAVWTWKDDLLNPPRQALDIHTSSIYPLVYPNPRNEDIDGDSNIDDDDAKTILGYTLDPNFDDRPGGGNPPSSIP